MLETPRGAPPLRDQAQPLAFPEPFSSKDHSPSCWEKFISRPGTPRAQDTVSTHSPAGQNAEPSPPDLAPVQRQGTTRRRHLQKRGVSHLPYNTQTNPRHSQDHEETHTRRHSKHLGRSQSKSPPTQAHEEPTLHHSPHARSCPPQHIFPLHRVPSCTTGLAQSWH